MNETKTSQSKPSYLHILLSLIVPGSGQLLAKKWERGLAFLFGIPILWGLSIWTIAQRARFPDYAISNRIFAMLMLQSVVLLLMVMVLRYIVTRILIKDKVIRDFSGPVSGILYIVLVFLLTNVFLNNAGSQADLKTVFGLIGGLAAAALAALWLWQAKDAGDVAASTKGSLPSMASAILFGCLLIFVLGYNITQINIPKAIIEYKDTSIIFQQLVWPWRYAFEYDQEVVEVNQKIQAPCPPGSTGPESNPPLDEGAWISVTPTCGNLTERSLLGEVTFGTELTIIGGGYSPNQEIDILWKNPIGNSFTPRGVGETKIITDDTGAFETKLFIPEVVISSAVALGDQVHTLIVREESEEVFSGRLSKEMKLSLAGMLETIMIGLMATFFGIILAFPFSFLAARNLMAPVTKPLNEAVGGLIGLITGLVLTFYLTGQMVPLLGGLEKAPIPIFLIALVLLFALGFFGMQLGTRLYTLLGRGTLGLTIATLSFGAIAGGIGFLAGIGFSRGIRAIPLTPEVAVQTELTYAWIGFGIAAILGIAFVIKSGLRGELPVGLLIYSVVRTSTNIIRSIEPLIWAIVALIWVGLGPFAGTIALTLHTIAALTKLYSESIESIDPGPIEALQATGANRLQTIVYAVVPQILPPFISFTIYRWDINVRMSTIIGVVGGGGIGFLVFQWMRLSQWEYVGIAMWLIAIAVSTLDFVSSTIRKRFV